MNPYTDGELDALGLLQTGIEVSHGSKNSQPSPYCSLRIIFMGMGVAKVDQETIAKVLGNIAIIALDNVGTHPLIRPYHVPVLFGVELAGKFGRVHQIAKHDSELPSFRVG